MRARKGTVRFQAAFRGITKRRELAAVKLQTYVRMYRRHKNFTILKSAMLALQCKTRVMIAKKELKGLMGEQKDIGKLKENNEKLKMEMQSLKAMLAAQAKEGASNAAHAMELADKQKRIDELEKRVADLEKQLAAEKAIIEKLEGDIKSQRSRVPMSPMRLPTTSPAIQSSTVDVDSAGHLNLPNLPSNFASPEVLAQHKAHLARLEDELMAERKLRREADGEIIKLRAAISGVQLNDAEVDALLAQKLESAPQTVESKRYAIQWGRPCVDFDFVCFFVSIPLVNVEGVQNFIRLVSNRG